LPGRVSRTVCRHTRTHQQADEIQRARRTQGGADGESVHIDRQCCVLVAHSDDAVCSVIMKARRPPPYAAHACMRTGRVAATGASPSRTMPPVFFTTSCATFGTSLKAGALARAHRSSSAAAAPLRDQRVPLRSWRRNTRRSWRRRGRCEGLCQTLGNERGSIVEVRGARSGCRTPSRHLESAWPLEREASVCASLWEWRRGSCARQTCATGGSLLTVSER
jgi:hypothetical protein